MSDKAFLIFMGGITVTILLLSIIDLLGGAR